MSNAFGFDCREYADYRVFSRASPHGPVAVTVVIPAFRAAATLQRAIASALGQTRRDIEIIIVDDASPDESWDLILDAMREDARIRAVRNKQNVGKSAAMNRAIALARGRWLAVLDADDWYHAERLGALVALGERKSVHLVADNQLLFDAGATSVVGTAWCEGPTYWELGFDEFLIGSSGYDDFDLGMLKPVMRLDFMRQTGLGYDERATHGEDFFHLLHFYLAGGRAIVSDKAYYYYTQPFGAISRQWANADRKRYDFQATVEIGRRCLDAARSSLTPRQAAWLETRNSHLQTLELYFQARECLRTGDLAGTFRRLLMHPEIMRYIGRRVRRRLGIAQVSTIERLAARARRVAPSDARPLDKQESPFFEVVEGPGTRRSSGRGG